MTLRAAAEQFTTVDAVRDTDCACIAEGDPDDDVISDVIDSASDILCIASGGRVFGRATQVVLPCADYGCFVACGCACGLDGIPLPGPDPKVSGVYIDDELVPSNQYAIHSFGVGYSLVRYSADGTTPPQPWPRHQEIWRRGQGDHTFRFTLTWGVHIDWVIQQAANELVCYILQDPQVRRQNTLPKGTTSLTQGGASISTAWRVRDQAVAKTKAGQVGPDTAAFMEIYAPAGQDQVAVDSPELRGAWTFHTLASAS